MLLLILYVWSGLSSYALSKELAYQAAKLANEDKLPEDRLPIDEIKGRFKSKKFLAVILFWPLIPFVYFYLK